MRREGAGFGLLTTSGTIICVESVTNVEGRGASLWVEVRLLTAVPARLAHAGFPVLVAPVAERAQASINAATIVAAFEIGAG
jgi:hypothetical protein